jgi:regulator of nucleoside diphosphate kinase
MDATDISPEVVTLGSIVHLYEVDTGERWKFTLSFPTNANIDEGRISVLAPLGTAILGHRVGDVVDWPVPSGMIRIQIVEIEYPPEAAGVFDEPELSVA